MNFTKQVLKDFAKLCNVAYLPSEKVQENFSARPYNKEDHCSVFYNCDSEPKLYSRARDSQMYVCRYNGMLSITFRGTESARDIITDLNILQVIEMNNLVPTTHLVRILSYQKSIQTLLA